MRPKEKGDIAIAKAINYFMSCNFEVCLPIGDKRDYDLVVEKEGKLQRVQVKYAGLYPGQKSCKVALRITGGNQSFHYSKKYRDDAFELLFVYTAKEQEFVVNWSEITARNELSIEHKKYNKYLINSSRVSEAVKHDRL
ncbi:hypothetical protein IPP75_00895 [Candidatus Saccharibacteria bacterium]|nr:MAG: hypothetical protein IPP75_00895 [Candidatus Saccharibacteria bacterium]